MCDEDICDEGAKCAGKVNLLTRSYEHLYERTVLRVSIPPAHGISLSRTIGCSCKLAPVSS